MLTGILHNNISRYSSITMPQQLGMKLGMIESAVEHVVRQTYVCSWSGFPS